jgi:hypothetical protein
MRAAGAPPRPGSPPGEGRGATRRPSRSAEADTEAVRERSELVTDLGEERVETVDRFHGRDVPTKSDEQLRLVGVLVRHDVPTDLDLGVDGARRFHDPGERLAKVRVGGEETIGVCTQARHRRTRNRGPLGLQERRVQVAEVEVVHLGPCPLDYCVRLTGADEVDEPPAAEVLAATEGWKRTASGPSGLPWQATSERVEVVEPIASAISAGRRIRLSSSSSSNAFVGAMSNTNPPYPEIKLYVMDEINMYVMVRPRTDATLASGQ